MKAEKWRHVFTSDAGRCLFLKIPSPPGVVPYITVMDN